MASYETSAHVTSCDCSTNTSKETAIEIPIRSTVCGCLHCPEAALWYKIVPNHESGEAPTYTVHSVGTVDSVSVQGFLYDSNDTLIGSNDEFMDGIGFFKIEKKLTSGKTYYLKVTGNGTDTGLFHIRFAKEKWPDSVTVSPERATLSVGQQLQLTVNVTPEGAVDNGFMFYSEDRNIASVHSGSATITAYSEGSTIIHINDCYQRIPEKLFEVTVIDNTEYHIIPSQYSSTTSKKALQVKMETKNDLDDEGNPITNKLLRLENDEKLEFARFSHINKQKWLLKRSGTAFKIYTQHGDNYCLCKKDGDYAYVSSSTSFESDVDIITQNNFAEIKLRTSNKYLTLSGNDIKWLDYDSSNHNNQLWKIEANPIICIMGLIVQKFCRNQRFRL